MFRYKYFIFFQTLPSVQSSQTLPCPWGPRGCLRLVLDVSFTPFPDLCFIKKALKPLCVCTAGLESPGWSLRTGDKEAVMTVSRGNTVPLFCFPVLFTCPQPANQVSSRNTACHSPPLEPARRVVAASASQGFAGGQLCLPALEVSVL